METGIIVSPTWLILSVIATLSLAVAAFITIRKATSMQKDERRQRLMSEIIEWATNMLECQLEFAKQDRELVTKATDVKAMCFLTGDRIGRVETSLTAMRLKGHYLRRVALSLDKGLHNEVGSLFESLTEYILFLRKDRESFFDFKGDWKEFSSALDASVSGTLEKFEPLVDKAIEVIKKATDLKIRSIA